MVNLNEEAANELDLLVQRFREQVSRQLVCLTDASSLVGDQPHRINSSSNDIDRQRYLNDAVSQRLKLDTALEAARGEDSLGYENCFNFQEDLVHPSQFVEVADDGILRFRTNEIVRYMVDNGPWDLNTLSQIGDPQDYAQLAQQIGYSVSGWSGLSMVNSAAYAAAEVEQELTKRRMREQAALNVTHLKDTQSLPGILQNIASTSDSTHNIPWEWAVLLHNAIIDEVRYNIYRSAEGTSVIMMFGDDEGMEVYEVSLDDSELTMDTEGVLTLSYKNEDVIRLTLDMELLHSTLRPHTELLVGVSMLFNHGMLQSTASFRPEYLYLILESVWRFMLVRSKAISLLTSDDCELSSDVIGEALKWLDGEWGTSRPVTGELVELLKRRPKGVGRTDLVLLCLYNIYHSGIHLHGGNISILQHDLSYTGPIEKLKEHINS